MKLIVMLLICSSPSAHSFVAQKTGPIVRESNDRGRPTHTINAGAVKLGVNSNGGGYVNYFSIEGGPNIVSPKFGRGWQGSIRDRYHEGRYNPTQAGFSDAAGTPVRVNIINNKKTISIPPFQMPLFGDPVFDFTENENLTKDAKVYKDQGKYDSDGLDERSNDQDDEIRSEFDYQGHYENVSSRTIDLGVSSIKHVYRSTYMRKPKAIYQFGRNAIKENGHYVLNPRYQLQDISRVIPGKQTASPIDLSNVIFTAYGIRLLTRFNYTTGMWHDGTKWNIRKKESFRGRGNEMNFQINSNEQQVYRRLNNNLLILSKGSNPYTSKAIGVYVPNNARNIKQTILRNRSNGQIKFAEDRRTRSYMFFSHVIDEQIGIRTRYFTTGLMAPNRGRRGYVEGLRHETYILYGTPQRILQAIKRLH